MSSKYSDTEFADIVKRSISVSECLKAMGLKQAGGNYSSFKHRIKSLRLDISHFRKQNWSIGLKLGFKRPLEEYLIVSPATKILSGALRKRLFSEGLKVQVCERCGISEWQGELAPLELHHINGNHDDNRLDNLQILCPNCHALTKNYRGKNKSYSAKGLIKPKRLPSLNHFCSSCNKQIRQNKHGMCMVCFRISTRKVERPSKIDLEILLSTNSYVAVGKMYNVTDNTIRKWLK